MAETPPQGSDHVPIVESDDEHDQLISDSVQDTEAASVEFTFVNEFALKEGPAPASNNSKRGRKRKIEATSADHGVDTEQASIKGAKKAKTRRGPRSKLAVFETSNDEEEPQALSIRSYLHLETTSQQPSRGKKPAVVITKSTQCNPFIFTIDTTFNAFIRAVADAAKTSTANLNCDKA